MTADDITEQSLERLGYVIDYINEVLRELAKTRTAAAASIDGFLGMLLRLGAIVDYSVILSETNEYAISYEIVVTRDDPVMTFFMFDMDWEP